MSNYGLRVSGCAEIAKNDKAVQINKLAEKLGKGVDETSIIYVRAIIKGMVKSGECKNKLHALELLEDRQVGYRHNSLMRSATTEAMNHRIGKLSRMTDSTPCKRYTPSFDGFSPEGIPLVSFDFIGTVQEEVKEEKRKHEVKVGVIVGSMYAEWERQEESYDSYNVFVAEHDRQAFSIYDMRGYFREYISRLSATIGKRLIKLVKDSADHKTIMIGDRPTKDGLFFARVYKSFEHADTVSKKEFFYLLKQYAV